MKKIPIIIMSMKSSPRLPILLERLKELDLKYKIFYGLEGKNKNEINKVYSFYDKQKVIARTGREMGFNEIGSAYTCLRVYEYCLKKKFKNVIIMNDDFYPSKLLKEWINKKIYFQGNVIVGFNCVPPGFLKKKFKILLDGKIKIHEARTHLFNSGCNQITSQYIKKFFHITKKKIIGNGDYPFNLKKHGITMYQTLPFLAAQNDKNFSFLASDRDKLERISFRNFRQILYKKFNVKFINKIFNLFRIPYYILFIPFIFLKYKNINYYFEYYLEKNYLKLINLIFKINLDIEDLYDNKSNYPYDLKKFTKYRVFDN